MKALGVLALVLGFAFYVGWPAYSGYEIREALEAKNVERLNQKVDFASVRASLRPAVAIKVEKELAKALRKAGPAGSMLTDDLKARFMPRLVDGVLAALVTPETLIRIHEQGGNLREALQRLAAERARGADALGDLVGGLRGGEDGGQGQPGGGLGKLKEIAGKLGIDTDKVLGGLGADEAQAEQPPAPVQELAATGAKTKRRYGLDNIKYFGLNGPLGVAVGVARDPAQTKPDVTAEMSFVDGDWKLTGLVLKDE